MDKYKIQNRPFKVLKIIADLVCERGNLSEIQNIIITYNKLTPSRPFDMNLVNTTLGGIGMLAEACSHGQLEYVRWMLANKCNQWILNENSETVSHMAISRNVVYDTVYGPDDKDPPNSAMSVIMTLMCHVEGLEKKNKVKFKHKIWERRNDWQLTPLDYAARKGGAEVLKFFISKGAKINGPLFSTQYGEIGDVERKTFIRLRVPDPRDNRYTRFGTSLLHQAIEYGNHDAFEILMEDGAHIHIYDAKGETPLMCAIRNRNFSVIERLIASPGIDVSQVHGLALEYISDVGTFPKTRDTTIPQPQFTNWTALHVLVSAHSEDESPEIVQVMMMLLNAGADTTVKDSFDRTPQEIAEYKNNATMVSVFQKWEDDRTMAFAMGQHERLGDKSRVKNLHPELVKWIDKIHKHSVNDL